MSYRHFGQRGLIAILALLLLMRGSAAVTARTVQQQEAQPGDVASVSAYAAPASLGAADAKLVTYWMRGFSGAMVQANAVVLTPMGTPPPGGWPIVVWIHGTTTGATDACAPSLTMDVSNHPDPDGGFYPYLMTQSLLVQSGYVTVSPDLEGLGTPGIYPYYNFASDGRAATAAAQAAHKVLSSTSPNWAMVGHSEGGHGALATTQYAAEAPELSFRGGVAIAPFDNILAIMAAHEAVARKSLQANDQVGAAAARAAEDSVVGLFATTVAAQTPGFSFDSVFGPDMVALAPSFQEDCIGVTAGKIFAAISAKGLDAFSGFKADWAKQPDIARFLAQNDAANLNLKVSTPLLVLEGDADNIVWQSAVTPVVEQMIANGSPVTYKTFPGADHGSVLAAGAPDMLAFLHSIFR
ncbi:MAG: alpha/beta hydrolase family protein [Dehalococcoidia bacterium]